MKKIIAYYLAIGFVLNFIWEMSQSGLYKSHFQGIKEFIAVHLRAALGDVIILLVIYLIASLVCKDKKWIVRKKTNSYALASLLGFIFAVGIEKYSLLTFRWTYNELMPIIPIINVGLTPVLQLTIIAPLSVFMAKRYISKQQ